jgi:hypothetical protein
MNISDNELRSLILKKYYDRRSEGEFQWKTEDFADLNPKIDFDQHDLYRVCDQLADAGLIEWHPVEGHNGRAIGGFGRIKGAGVDVIEGTAPSPIPIHVDQSHHFTITNGHHNIVGDQNVQSEKITIEHVARAINEAKATQEQKDTARSVLKRAFEEREFYRSVKYDYETRNS